MSCFLREKGKEEQSRQEHIRSQNIWLRIVFGHIFFCARIPTEANMEK
jgi:hypothetical protein